MADIGQLQAALIGADKAGDVEGAKTLAAELRRLTTSGLSAHEQAVQGTQEYEKGIKSFAQDPGNYEVGPVSLKLPAGVSNAMAGYYKGARDAAFGTAQLASPVLGNTEEMRKQVAEQRQLDAPLMATGAGRAGELAFNVASTVPTLAIPGVNTVRGAALLGGAFGLAQPSESGKETLLNTGVGAALGGAGQAVANKLVSATAPVLRNARDAILAKAADLGFVVSPSEGRGTLVNKLVTGLGNKQQTAQDASIKNAGTLEKIAKKDLGLPETEVLEPATFQAVRSSAYQQGYKPVEGLNIIGSDPQFERSMVSLLGKESQGKVTRAGQGEIADMVEQIKGGQWTGKQLVDDIRTLREEGASNIGKIKSIGEQQLGRAQLEAAKTLEDLAERNLALNNAPADLIQNFRAARATIAKSHTIEDAMEKGGIDARKFAKSESDAKKLSPEMYAAWKFAKEFPKSNQTQAQVAGTPWNVAVQSGGLGALGLAASETGSGSPYGIALGALPLLRGPARSAALSRTYQGTMVNPVTAAGPRLAAIAAPTAQRLQRIAPQVSTATAMEIE